MKTVSYYDYAAYLKGGHPTETENPDKTNVYVKPCIVLRPKKMNRQPKMGTSDGNALQVI